MCEFIMMMGLNENPRTLCGPMNVEKCGSDNELDQIRHQIKQVKIDYQRQVLQTRNLITLRLKKRHRLVV